MIAAVGVSDVNIPFRVGAAAPAPAAAARGENLTPQAIPDANPAGIVSRIAIAAAGKIKRITATIAITHTYIGDLIVELTAPSGAKAMLHNRAGGSSDNLGQRYDSVSVASLAALVGQAAQGDWLLAVRDLEGQDIGTLDRWSLEFALDAAEAPSRGEATPNLAIPDNNPTGVSSRIAIARAGSVGQVKVAIDITHTYIGDLRIELVAPSGRSVVLHAQLGGGQDNLVVSYDSAAPLSPLAALRGQAMQGDWALHVVDAAAVDIGTLNKWAIDIVPAM